MAGDANQIPSYVTAIPDGSETGVYLAIDLGGTNCRVCSVELHGNSKYTLRQTKHVVPRNLRVNSRYEPLFRFIAANLHEFLAQHHPEAIPVDGKTPAQGEDGGISGLKDDGRRQLGFTFSFTCDQTSLEAGTLVHWDKGWDIPSAVGRDPCAMLQRAIDDLRLPVVVSALANDSVGALLARAYSSGTGQATVASAIFGTGTNAAYIEQMANVTKLRGKPGFRAPGPADVTIINTEWGCFDEELKVLPTTQFDEVLDGDSPQRGKQMLEKRVGALYVGELLRLAVVHLMETVGFDMVVPKSSLLFRKEEINASLLSSLAGDASPGLDSARDAISQALGATNVSQNDAKAMQTVAVAITRRAARIAGASLAAIIIRSGRLQQEQDELVKPQSYTVDERRIDASPNPEPRPHRRGGFVSSLVQVMRKLLRLCGMRWLAECSPPDRKASESSSSLSGPEPTQPVPRPAIDIGVDGSLIEFYPGFETEIRGALREVPEVGSQGEGRITIGLSKNGSSVGAALMALAASRQKV